jgi:hypothetical protein
VFLLWAIAVGIASVDNDTKNVNIISVLLAAVCLRINLGDDENESHMLWANSPKVKDLSSWIRVTTTVLKDCDDSDDWERPLWFRQVLLVKLLPDIFSEITKRETCQDIAVGDEWLSNAIRKSLYLRVQNCLQEYDPVKGIPITCFDYLGLIVWSTLMEIENHIFINCNLHTTSVPVPEYFHYSMRNRSKICLLANNHKDCPDIQHLLSRIETFVENNQVIYKTIAHVFQQYQPVGALPNLKPNQTLSEWWYYLANLAMCPKFPISHNLLLVAYIYELMEDRHFSSHFQYANTLEQLSLTKGAKVNFDISANQLKINYDHLEINVPCLSARLPDSLWYYVDGRRSVRSQGMIRVFIHLKMIKTGSNSIEQAGYNVGSDIVDYHEERS